MLIFVVLLALFQVVCMRPAAAFTGVPHTEFPMGTFIHNENLADIPIMKSLGLNLFIVVNKNPDEAGYQQIKPLLDEAYRNNMKVIVPVMGVFWQSSAWNTLPAFIEKVKAHPALYGYYLADEPELYSRITVEGFTNLHKIVKQYDPNHPTIVVFSAYLDDVEHNAKRFFGIADIAGFDLYPFSPNSTTTANNLTSYYQTLDKFISLHAALPQSSTKSYFMVLQAFTDQWRREPTQTELTQFITNNLQRTNLMQGFLYYDYRTNSTDSHGYEALPTLKTSITAINTTFKTRTSTVPVVLTSGDGNGDGKVDGVDYMIWRTNYNSSTTNGVRSGDFNLDGRVDGIDYMVWRTNYIHLRT